MNNETRRRLPYIIPFFFLVNLGAGVFEHPQWYWHAISIPCFVAAWVIAVSWGENKVVGK